MMLSFEISDAAKPEHVESVKASFGTLLAKLTPSELALLARASEKTALKNRALTYLKTQL